MATTPGSPVMQGLKNFWQRPEGTVGKVALVLGGIAAAYGFVQVLPFLIAAATDTLHLALLIGAILVFLFIVTDKRVRTLAKVVFQSIMRYLTGLFIELDPIGILKNYIGEMKKNLGIMDEQLGNLNGSIRTLQNQIDTNQKDADHSMSLANQADKKMAAGGLTSLDQQQYMAAKVTNQRHAASLININKSLTDLRDKLKILYDQLIRWRATAEFQVTDKENRVSEEEMRRKALKKAYSVFQAAKKIFRGDPVANQIYDQTLEYLADDAGQMLGEMEDFNRLANKLMTNMDLETGAINDEAVKQLSEFQQKLLPASVTTVPGGVTDPPSAVPANKKDDYSDLIK
jgi:phage shock protein A